MVDCPRCGVAMRREEVAYTVDGKTQGACVRLLGVPLHACPKCFHVVLDHEVVDRAVERAKRAAVG